MVTSSRDDELLSLAPPTFTMQKRTRNVLLFRAAKEPEDSYDLALKEALYAAHFIPALHFQFTNQDALSSALLDSSKYSGLVFTSQTAVEAASRALGSAKVEQLVKQWASQPVFVVGKATAQAVNQLGLKTFGSYSGNAEALSEVILDYFSCREKDRPLLFPCSKLKRETLPSILTGAGLGLEVLVCYNTEPHPQILENIDRVVTELGEGETVCAVFFSPSGVNYALDKFLEATKSKVSTKFLAIGPTSAEALSNHGHPPAAVAAKPTPDSLVQALASAPGPPF